MARYPLRKLIGFTRNLGSPSRKPIVYRPNLLVLETRVTPSVTDLNTHLSYATIQAAVNAANPGDTLLADAGTYNEHVTINRSLTLEGAQHGVDARTRSGSESIVNGGGYSPFYVTANDVTIDGFTIEGADGSQGNVFPGGFGVELAAGTSGAHVVNDIIQNNIVGIALTNVSTNDQAVVQHDLFQNNTDSGPAGGTDIYADQFTAGSGGVNDVLIDSNTFANSSFVTDAWALGISNTGNTPFSTITFSNNTVTNHGRGVYFYNTTNSSVTGNTITGASHYAIGIFGNNGTPASSAITISNNQLNENGSGGAAIELIDDTTPGTAYSGTLTLAGDHISTSGTDRSIDNESTTSIGATGEYFNGTLASSAATAQLFAVEDTIVDAIDVSGFGLVRLKAGNVYVTPNSFDAADGTTAPSIQRAVDVASSGDTVNVEAGTYTGLVSVTKTLTFLGAQSGVDARTRNVPASQESIVTNSEGDFQIEADNVVIDGFTLEGVTADPSTDPASLGAAIWTNPGFSGTHGGTQVLDNIIQGNIAGVELDNDGTLQTKVQHNLFKNNNQPGANSGLDIEVDFGLVNALIDANTFTNSSFVENSWALGIEAASSNITFSNNTVTKHGRGVFFFDTTQADITDNSITGATHYGIGLLGGDSNFTIVENDLSNDARGLDIEDDLGGSPNSKVSANMCNSFANDSVFGVGIVNVGTDNGYTGTLDVGFNWWGNLTGPALAANPSGTGANIKNDYNDTIIYAPWGTSAACTTFTAGPGIVIIGTELFIGGGSTSNDQVHITPIGSSNTGSTGIRVQTLLNHIGTNFPMSQSFTAINITLQNGNENVQLADSLTIPVVVTAGNGNDNIHLANGDSTVILGNGNDNLRLGGGNNSATLGNGNDNVTAGNGNNTVTVGNGNDNIHLGNGANVITAGSGNDDISAGSGTNTVVAGAVGSLGNIHVQLGNGAHDSVTLLGNGNENVSLGNGDGDSVTATGNGNDNVRLGNGNDSVTLGNGRDSVQAGNGDDTVSVGNGNDVVRLGNGTNKITAGTGSNFIQAGDGANTVMVGAAGARGNVRVQLGNGDSNSVTVLGNGSVSVQVGSGFADSVTIIGNGNDSVSVGDGQSDTVTVTGNGNDNVHVGSGNSDSVSVTGNGNDNVNIGSGLNDFVSLVGSGNDSLQTGNGTGQVHISGAGHKNVHIGGGWTQI